MHFVGGRQRRSMVEPRRVHTGDHRTVTRVRERRAEQLAAGRGAAGQQHHSWQQPLPAGPPGRQRRVIAEPERRRLVAPRCEPRRRARAGERSQIERQASVHVPDRRGSEPSRNTDFVSVDNPCVMWLFSRTAGPPVDNLLTHCQKTGSVGEPGCQRDTISRAGTSASQLAGCRSHPSSPVDQQVLRPAGSSERPVLKSPATQVTDPLRPGFAATSE